MSRLLKRTSLFLSVTSYFVWHHTDR